MELRRKQRWMKISRGKYRKEKIWRAKLEKEERNLREKNRMLAVICQRFLKDEVDIFKTQLSRVKWPREFLYVSASFAIHTHVFSNTNTHTNSRKHSHTYMCVCVLSLSEYRVYMYL